MSNHGQDTKTDLDRLRDAVVQAARVTAREIGATQSLFDALAALDAHPTRATAETVRVAVWEDTQDGDIMIVRAGGHLDRQRAAYRHYTRLGTTTLRLDTEAEG